MSTAVGSLKTKSVFNDELYVKEMTADDFYAQRVSREHWPLTHNQIMEQNCEGDEYREAGTDESRTDKKK